MLYDVGELAGHKASTNGVYLNGRDQRITGKISLNPGDTLQVGYSKLVLTYASSGRQQEAMEVRGGGVAGSGGGALPSSGVTNEMSVPASVATGAASRRRALSKATEGGGTAARSGASSRQPDHEGPAEGSDCMSPWQSPASQHAIFTGQWQPCCGSGGAAILARAKTGSRIVAARTATSAPAKRRDPLCLMTDPF